MKHAIPAMFTAALMTCAITACSGDGRHFTLTTPAVTGDALPFTCTVVKDSSEGQIHNCQRARTNKTDDNRAGTLFFNLPAECKGHFSQIVLHDAESDNPTLTVTCAQARNGAGGGSSSDAGLTPDTGGYTPD